MRKNVTKKRNMQSRAMRRRMRKMRAWACAIAVVAVCAVGLSIVLAQSARVADTNAWYVEGEDVEVAAMENGETLEYTNPDAQVLPITLTEAPEVESEPKNTFAPSKPKSLWKKRRTPFQSS